MPYMTQSMSSGRLPVIMYYRKQSKQHASHSESGKFTTDAIAAYATANNIPTTDVVTGTYRSGQGVPRSPDAEEI